MKIQKRQGGIFSSGRKSPKDKSDKDKDKDGKKLAIAITEKPLETDAKQQKQDKPSSPSHTRPYEYTESEGNISPTRRTYTPGGFRYDEDPVAKARRDSENAAQSPNSQAKRATGYAFNYAPGDDDALRQQAEKLKSGELSPKSKDKTPKEIDIGAPIKTSKSYSPNEKAAAAAAEIPQYAGVYKPTSESIGDPHSAAFLENERADSKVPIIAPAVLAGAAPSDTKKKRVKILVLISSLDPKTKRIDTNSPSAVVEHSTGILTENGIETKYGLLHPEKSTLQILNSNGNTETYQGARDGKTGNIHFVSGGVSNPATGQLDNSLGQIVCVAPQDKAVIEVTGITGRLDPRGNVDIANGAIERSKGILDVNNDTIDTKYGVIDLKTCEIRLLDPKTGKPTTKKGKYDRSTGLYTIPGAIDAKGKYDQNLHQVVALGSEIDPVVEITSVIGKADKKGILDGRTSTVENTTGQINGNKIDTKYGQIDLVKHTLTSLSDGKSKDFKIDPATSQIVIKNVVNPKTSKADKDNVQLLSLKIVNRRIDPTGKVSNSADNKDIVVDKTNKIWIATKDPQTNEPSYYTSSQLDPKTGTITIIYGLINPKTNEIEKQTKLLPSVCVANSDGALYTSTGDVDEHTHEPIFATSIIEPDTKSVITKVARVSPQTGEIILVRVDYPKQQALPTTVQEKTTPIKPIEIKETVHQSKHVTPPKVPESGKATTPPKTPIVSETIATTTTSAPTPVPAAAVTRQQSPPSKGTTPPKSTTDASAPIAIVPQKTAIIEIVTIVGKVGPDGKIDLGNAQLERSRGILNVQNGTIQTKYGLINPSKKEVSVTDKSGKTTTTKPITIDASGQIIIDGGTDGKGKPERHIINLGPEVEQPIVEITGISGKYDAKKGIIEPKTAVVAVTQGQYDPDNNTITTSYGEIDIPSSTITFKHPKSGKLEKKPIQIDQSTGQVILRNEVNPKNNKLDKDYGRILSLRIVNRKIDPSGKVKTPTVTGTDIIVDPQTNQLWIPEGKDPVTQETVYVSTQVDPKGYIITIYGYLNPKTNRVEPNTAVESNITKADDSGQLFTASGEVDDNGDAIYVASQIDEDSNEVFTKVAKIDKKTGKLVLIKIILITKKVKRIF